LRQRENHRAANLNVFMVRPPIVNALANDTLASSSARSPSFTPSAMRLL
jgi:hypothetical protein